MVLHGDANAKKKRKSKKKRFLKRNNVVVTSLSDALQLLFLWVVAVTVTIAAELTGVISGNN